MCKRVLLVLIMSMLQPKVFTQVPGLGRCPEVNVVRNFDAQRYLGLWYEVEKYPFLFTLGGKCITAEYGQNPNGTVSVFNRQYRGTREETILGLASLNKPGVGTLTVTFPSVPFQGGANYNVLDTDYDSYAVVFSCNSFLGLVNGQVVWILSRQRFPPRALLDRAHEVMKENGLSLTFLATTDNNDCPDELPNTIESFRY